MCLVGCRVVDPPGWPGSSVARTRLAATPGKSVGIAPTSWDDPRGGRVRVDIRRARVIRAGTSTHADLDLVVAHDRSTGPRIRCRTRPDRDGGASRFGCWSETDPSVHFAVAPHVSCPEDDQTRTQTTPACWEGVATIAGRRVELRRGYVERTGSPIGRVSWVRDEQPILAADIIGSMQIELVPLASTDADADRMLTMMTVALHFWEHAVSES